VSEMENLEERQGGRVSSGVLTSHRIQRKEDSDSDLKNREKGGIENGRSTQLWVRGRGRVEALPPRTGRESGSLDDHNKVAETGGGVPEGVAKNGPVD